MNNNDIEVSLINKRKELIDNINKIEPDEEGLDFMTSLLYLSQDKDRTRRFLEYVGDLTRLH